MRSFHEFSEESTPLEGKKVRLDDILNIEVVFKSFRVSDSKFTDRGDKKFITMQLEREGTPIVCFSGSQVLINQAIKYQQHMPFITTFKKVDRYYTFS